MRIKFDTKRPLSWSSISSFEYNPETWAMKYLEKEEEPASAEMLFGNVIGTRIAKDKKFLPDVLRYKVFEQELKASIGKIDLIGYIDSFDPKTCAFYEYKTSSNNKRWNFKKAQEHGQILMYLYMIWKTYKVRPEDVKIRLFYIPVHKKDGEMALKGEPVQSWEIRHTSAEVLAFCNRVIEVRDKMIRFAETRIPSSMSMKDTLAALRS